MASIAKRPNGNWRARYRDPSGKEHAGHFERKVDAQAWLDDETAKLVTGRWVDPNARKVTVGEWAETWLDGYARRPSTVKQARTHVNRILEEFGSMPVSAVRPSQIRAWIARLGEEGYADSYRHALHQRLSQIMTDAVHDRLIARTHVRGARHRAWGSSGSTWPPRNRSGLCTTPSLSGAGSRSYSGRSQV